ncbi:MAG: hypothetical protein U0470_01670 [Anaerolineae bacterium]
MLVSLLPDADQRFFSDTTSALSAAATARTPAVASIARVGDGDWISRPT